MGVHGLWELLSPVGHRVSNEHVRNKVLAVDISIWLTQFVKAMRDAEGAQVRNAHLLGVFRRCIKLLYLSVRPVLVFDGATPALKRKTLAGRRAMRDRHEAKLRRLAERMLVNRMKINVLGAAIRTKRKGSRSKGTGGSAKRKQLDIAATNVQQERKAAAANSEDWKRKRNDQAEVEELEQDCIQPVHSSDAVTVGVPKEETTIPPEVVRMQEEKDAIFAADLADEEEVMTRERDATPIDMPYDVDDIDDGCLENLPPTMQSEIFKQIKLNQRARHRERMLLQRNDPALFSQAQIEGFLQNTALNRKIRSARSALNDKSGASQRIASDSKRQYVLEDKNESNLNGEDGFSSDGSSDDDLLAANKESSSGSKARAPPDILAQLRAKRDAGLGVLSARREERNQIRRENEQKRSGVGWASRVLEGKGGLVLGGRSALGSSSREATKVISESDSESWEDAGYNDGVMSNDNRNTAVTQIKSGEDDSDEWEDGDAIDLPNDSEKALDFGYSVNNEKVIQGHEVSVKNCSRHGNTQPRLSSSCEKKDAADKKEQKARQGNSEKEFLGVDEISTARRAKGSDICHQRRRRGLIDLDTIDDGDSELLGEVVVADSQANSNENSGIIDEKGKSSSSGKCETHPDHINDTSEQEELKKPEFSDQRSRRGLLDLDAVSDDDSEASEPVGKGSPPAGENTSVDPVNGISKERVTSEGASNSRNVAVVSGDGVLRGGKSSKKPSPVLRVELGTESGNTSHAAQTVVPDTLQTCNHSVPRVSHGPDHSYPSKLAIKTPSSDIGQQARAKVNKPSKQVRFPDMDASTQPQPAVELTEDFQSAADLKSADCDLSRVQDASESQPEMVRSRRRGDNEEHEDMQLAIALSLQEGKSQGRPKAREQEAGSFGNETSSLTVERTQEKKGVPGTEQLKNSGGAPDPDLMDVGNATGQKTSHVTQAEVSVNSREDRKSSDVADSVQAHDREPHALSDELEAVQGDESRHFEAAGMSAERMQELRDELQIEERELMRQKSSHQGGAESVSEEMYGEARDLLKLFGIPYLEAPEEAEAQCAFLNTERVVDGVITEDSDAFLFGAQTVYRKLFSEGQFAEAYEAEHIHSKLGLDRELLIRLAYLLGSDYTIGVRGVGVVNSMEILEAFPGENGLEEFRDWTQKVTVFDEQPGEEVMTGRSQEAIRRKFCWKHRNMKRNWEIRPEFPNKAVAEAYIRPRIDPSTERFKWGRVDFAGLRRFCWEKFGWEEDRFDAAVGPLRQKLKDDLKDKGQTRIDEFFKPHRFAKIRSVRLQSAVTGMVGAEAADLMADALGRPKVKRRKTAAVTNVAVDSDEEKEMMAAVEDAERKLREKTEKER